jgi:hypothetical protein
MEGVLLVAGVVAVLVGLGAVVEAVRPWRGGQGESRSILPGSSVTAHLTREPFGWLS